MLLFSNNAFSTLAAALSNAATVLQVQPADANLFPQPSAGTDYFVLTIEDQTQNPTAREIVKCTGRAGANLTIVRAQEGTAAQAFGVNVSVRNGLTAGSLNALAANVAQSSQLYLGSFAAAPTQTNSQGSLFAGLLYFNSTTNQMFEYSGTAWAVLAGNSSTTSSGDYIGAFAVAPTQRPDGSALQAGDLYFNTVAPTNLYEFTAGAWAIATGSSSLTGSSTIDGNLVVDGNLTVTGTSTLQGVTATELDSNNGTFQSLTVVGLADVGSLDIGGKPVVEAADLSGTANSQSWPNGNQEKWGSSATGSAASATIVFPVPFPNACTGVQITVTGNEASTSNTVISLDKTAAGFKAGSFAPNGAPNPNVAFDWTAKGN